MVVMMDMEISCKGHCEKSSHFLDHVSHTDLRHFHQIINFTDNSRLRMSKLSHI